MYVYKVSKRKKNGHEANDDRTYNNTTTDETKQSEKKWLQPSKETKNEKYNIENDENDERELGWDMVWYYVGMMLVTLK